MRDPNAMDMSPGRVCARVAGSEQANPNNAEEWGKFVGGRGTPALCRQGRANGFNLREVTCYNCRKVGHFSRDCPQQSWNQKGNHPWETNPFRSDGEVTDAEWAITPTIIQDKEVTPGSVKWNWRKATLIRLRWLGQ